VSGAGPAAPPPALPVGGRGRAVDLSHPLAPGLAPFPGHPAYRHERLATRGVDAVATHHRLVIGEHTGTHVDAPLHFGNAEDVTAFAPAQVLSRAAVLRVPAGAARLAVADLEAFERAHGPLTAGDSVLVHTGWDAHWGTDTYMAGPWPSLTAELAAALVRRGVALVAGDTPSLDDAPCDVSFPVHEQLLGAGAFLGENFTGLADLPAWVSLVVAPLPIVGGSGSPVRAVAYC
jgi:kynurenine formamidase